MAYTLSVVNKSVVALNDTGYYGAWQGFGVVEVRQITDGQAWFRITVNGEFVLQIRQDAFTTIGGVAPAGTIVGIMQQIADLFTTAYPGGGGSGGSASFLAYTVNPVAGPSTSVTVSGLIGKTLYALIINDYVKNTGFTGPNGSGTVTLTDGSTFNGGDQITFLISQ